MCGIAGMYTYKRNDLCIDYFKWCLSTMKHRGPDSQTIWHNNQNYISAFSRLAIRDLSINGNQPMLSECNNYCITYNGEIYNTQELTSLLSPYRFCYKSSSDTEVLMYALIHLGINKTLEVADGIFAFAFYDIRQNKLFLARDRVGVKPLYVGTSSNGIVYSSQYNHIVNHPFFEKETFDASVVGSYLSLGYMPENCGVVTNTKLLPHGYYLIVEQGRIKTCRYYSYGITNESKVEELDDVLNNSVCQQLVSDVPVGTFMSGGVDSTLVSYFASNHTCLKSFTIGIKDSKLDESIAAKEFGKLFKTDHYCKYITSADLLHLVKENQQAFTEPFADFSSLPLLYLSKFAKQKITVALSGDGGDELFWGYPRQRKALNFIPYYSKSLWKKRGNLLLKKITQPQAIELLRHWKAENFISYYYSTLYISGAMHLLPQIFKVPPSASFFLDEYKNFCNEKNNNVNALMNIIRKMEVDIHLQRILLKVDRSTMYYSLEARVPFLNNAMLKHSLSYNYLDCINSNDGKMVLKNALIKKSNKDLVMQPKKGFIIPIDEWIRKEIKNEIEEKIMDMPSYFASMFHRNKLHGVIKNYMNGKANWGWFVWAVYSLVAWDSAHRKR